LVGRGALGADQALGLIEAQRRCRDAAPGALLILSGLSITLGLFPAIGLRALILFLISAAGLCHNFWAVSDTTERTNQASHFLNVALAGAALMSLPFHSLGCSALRG